MTLYSYKIPGDKGNWMWAVVFDKTQEGYLGISQSDDNGRFKDRILLSPKQIKELQKFLTKKVPK